MGKINSLVRVHSKLTDSHVGMGVLISADQVLTCTHVVCIALGMDKLSKPECNVKEVTLHLLSSFISDDVRQATVELCYACCEDKPFRDVTILKLKKPIEEKISFPPLIHFRSSLSISRKPCSIYYDNGHKNFGWGLGIIIDEVKDSRIQITQTNEAGKIITTGFSGSPVWVEGLGGVVGIVDQASTAEKLGTFIPINAMADILPPIVKSNLIEVGSNNENIPKLPADYIPRHQILKQIQSLIYSNNTSCQNEIVVITGPSGAGKTSLALHIFHNHIGKACWVDMTSKESKLDYNRKEFFFNKTREHDLVIIDNLTIIDKLLNENWIQEVNAKIIITTATEDVATLAVLKNNCEPSQKIVHISGLDEQEAFGYIKSSIGSIKLSDKQIEYVLQKTGRLVILLKFFVEIINKEQIDKIQERYPWLIPFNNEPEVPQMTEQEMVIKLVNQWINVEEFKEKLPLIMVLLCKIPVVGMSWKALSYLLRDDMSETVVLDIIKYLINKGFVSVHGSKFNSHKSGLLIPHALIKENLIFDKSDVIKKFTHDYLTIFDNASQLDAIRDIGEYINLAMVKMDSLFVEYRTSANHDLFLAKFETLALKIHEQIPQTDSQIVDSEWIASLFKATIPKSSCSGLISLGQLVKRLPSHVLLAEAIWAGSQNYDSWARACCIHAAATHWCLMDENKIATESLANWLQSYINDRSMFDPNKGRNTYSGPQYDLDIACALAGLCYQNQAEKAIRILNSDSFRRNISITTLSDLTVILFLIGQNRLEKAQGLIDRFFSRVSVSSARELAINYIRRKGLSIDCFRNETKVVDTSVSLTLAVASANKEFYSYVHKEEPNSKTSIGLVSEKFQTYLERTIK